MHEIILTREDANSDSALLVEWLVPDHTLVRAGDVICVIETSKSTIEIESPGDGTLRRLAQAGTDVELGSRIAVVAEDPAELASLDALPVERTAPPAGEPNGKATRKAIELAAEHGLDLSTIVKTGFVTADDVLEALAARQAESGSPQLPGLEGLSLTNISLPQSALTLNETTGLLEPGFLESLRANPAAVRSLPPSERADLYRRHGAEIGSGAHLGARTVIIAPRIVLGENVRLGSDSTLECDDVLSIGALTKFGDHLVLRCRRAFIGAGGYFADRVNLAGGGSSDPQSLLVIGDMAFVGAEAFINPCRPVVIGREVFVTMRSVLVTHNVGHSLLEGFENRFAPIVIEDRAQIGIGTVVYAGSRVGKESIVGSNSYVVSDIPPGKLAIGVPARVSGDSHRTPSPRQQTALAGELLNDLRTLLQLRNHDVEVIADGFVVNAGARASQVLLVERLTGAFQPPTIAGETVVLTLGLDVPAPQGIAVLDLLGRQVYGDGGVVLDSVREYCRKRGIRFQPEPWRYGGGLV